MAMVPLFLALLALSHAACPPDVSSYTTWPTAWNVAGGPVTIAASQKIIVTTSPNVVLGAVTVNGILRFADANIKFNASSIFIKAGGSLIAGTQECPITNKLYLTMCGAAPNPRTTNLIGTDPYDNTAYGAKGIVAAWNGTLQLYGKYPALTWTHISKTAQNGSLTITLVAPVSWVSGDEIIITNTDLAESLNATVYPKMNSGSIKPDQHEKRKIVSVSSDGKTITLDSRLLFTHYADANIKAEVGLLTRRIVVQGDEQSAKEAFGSHMQLRRGPAPGSTVISGVEFYRVGQTNVLGRYPIHFHVSHLLYGMGVKAVGNAIHESYQRCISVHEAHGVLIQDNVAFNIAGHCYFLEDGSEMGNVLDHNLGARVLPMVPPLLYHDGQPSVFWIANPNNTITNNAASGSNIGYWYALPMNAPNGAGGKAYPKMSVTQLPFGTFANNIAHSMIGWGVEAATMDNYNSLLVAGFGGPGIQWQNLTAYKCRSGAIWSRARPGVLSGGYWADFGQLGLMPLNGQLATNITLVGRSPNVGLYPPASESCGIGNYDAGSGTASIGLTFINFTGAGYGGFCDSIGAPQYYPPNNWGIRNKFVNSNPTFITGGAYGFYGVSMRAFLDDGSGTKIPYGGFLAGYQPYWNVSTNGGKWSQNSNSINIPYFHGGLFKLGFYLSNDHVQTLDTVKYGRSMYRTGIYVRPLGQNGTAPGFHGTNWADGYFVGLPSTKMWSVMLISNTGARRSMASNFTLPIEMGKKGDWAILAVPFNELPSNMQLRMDYSPNTLFTPVQAFKDLLVNTYFWNTEDKHLYFPVTCGDIAGSYNGYTRSDYYRYVAQCEVRFTSTYAQKTTTSLTSAAYISPKVPATVPAWTVFTKFSARVYNQAADVSLLVQVQLYKKSFNGFPAIVWQTYQNQTDYNHRINFKDAKGNVLWSTEPVSLTGAGHMRYITAEFWNQINNGQVYVTMDLNGKELMRTALLAEDAKSSTIMSVANSGFSCSPQYKNQPLFSEALYNSTTKITTFSGYTRPVASNITALCGKFSLYVPNTYSYKNPLNISIPILPYVRVADYSSVEFAVKGATPDYYIDLTVWSVDKQNVTRAVPVSGLNNYNRVIDSRGWAIVRVPLNLLGGSSLTSVGLYATTINTQAPGHYLYVDELRLAANSSVVPAPVFTARPTPTVGNDGAPLPNFSSDSSEISSETSLETSFAQTASIPELQLVGSASGAVVQLFLVVLAVVFAAV